MSGPRGVGVSGCGGMRGGIVIDCLLAFLFGSERAVWGHVGDVVEEFVHGF